MVAQQGQHLDLVAKIQRAGWFIKDQKARGAVQALGDQRQLLLPARQPVHPFACQMRDAAAGQDSARRVPRAGRDAPAKPLAPPQKNAFLHRQRGFHGIGLRQKADLFARRCAVAKLPVSSMRQKT